MPATMKNDDLIDYWKITKMEVWGQAYVDLVVPGFVEFEMEGDHLMGQFQFGTVVGWLDCRLLHGRVRHQRLDSPGPHQPQRRQRDHQQAAYLAMAIDPKAFRRTVGHFVTGVTVIAADIEGSMRGMTANAFASLSLDPPLVLFCVAKKAHLGQVIHLASGFSVNILTQEQQSLSTYFAGGWKEPEPPAFSFEPWQGGPKLAGSSAALGCSVETIHEGGDHFIVIGRVLALYHREPQMAPLVFNVGRYAALAEPRVADNVR